MQMQCAVTESVCLLLACDVVAFEVALELNVAPEHTGPPSMVSQRRRVKNAFADCYFDIYARPVP